MDSSAQGSFKKINHEEFFKSPLPMSILDSPSNMPKESLGILHESFGNASFSDYGKDLPKMNISDFGKESLGILHFKHTDFKEMNDEDFFKSPLPLCKIDSPGNFPRESLGILHESFGNASFGDYGRDLPRVSISDFGKESLGIINFMNLESKNDILLNTSNNTSDFSMFNMAFLEQPSQRVSVLSSISSNNSTLPSYDGRSLKGISKISSISEMDNMSNNAAQEEEILKNNDNVFYESSNTNNSLFNKGFLKNHNEEVYSIFGSVSSNNSTNPTKMQSYSTMNDLKNISAQENTKEIEKNPQEKTEAKSEKTKLSKRRSFCEGLEDNDDVFYNSICIESRCLAQKISDGSIYEEGIDVKLENEMPPFLVITSPENSPTKSPNARELLQNLSDILQNRSNSQQSEGRKLLSSLADIFISSNNESSEDSGRSSICDNNLSDENYKVLKESNEEKSPNTEKHQTPLKGKENLPLMRQASLPNKINNLVTLKPNLKPVKAAAAGPAKKGPLKAVLPVSNMVKKKVMTTPKKTQLSPAMAIKKTSTPNFKEKDTIFHSTPTEKKTRSRLPQLATTPLKFSSPTYGSSPVLSKNRTPMFTRQTSFTDTREVPFSMGKMRRCNSVGKEVGGLLGAMSHVRENLTRKLSENNNFMSPENQSAQMPALKSNLSMKLKR